MPHNTGLNVALDLLSVLVVAILLFSQVEKRGKTRQDRLFVALLIGHLFCAVSETITWAFDTWPGAFFRVLTTAGTFLNYVGSAVTYLPFLLYIMAATGQREAADRRIFRAACGLSGVMLSLAVLNFFNGMLFTIDAANVFRAGDWEWFFFFLVLVQLLTILAEILRCRGRVDRLTFRMFLAFDTLPILAILLSLVFPDLTLVYPAAMLSLLLVYVNVQQEQEKRLSRQELELAESRTATMVSQIQPHFLYNALTAVGDLCETDPHAAKRAISNFARYLRGNMSALTQKQPVPFASELQHIQYYLELEQMRFREKLHVVLDIGPTGFLVPPLSVQPLVENAVKHGVTCRRTGGTVTLRTEERPEAWVVVVEDDGVGFDPAAPPESGQDHVGLSNVRSRLTAMVGGVLDIESAPGAGTRAKIIIPKEAPV